MTHIHVSDVEELTKEFAKVKKPRSIPRDLINAPLDILEDAGVVGVKLNPIRKLLRKFSEASAYRVAAWRWLRPSEAPDRQETLVDLQCRAELNHIEHRAFCARLIEACHEIIGDTSRLSRYVEARVAEIEFRLHVPMPGDDEALHGFEQLQALYTSATLSHSADVARTVCRQALMQVGAIAKSAIVGSGKTECTLDANLMVPSSSAHMTQGAGRLAADSLWLDFGRDSSEFLVAVEEAPSAPPLHRGFWIPGCRLANRPLPGAPSALYYGAPQTIFVDDLPTLHTGDEALKGRWRNYFCGDQARFRGSLFMSFPVKDGESDSVAVINVNIRDQIPWYRTLSRSWMARAARLAGPWMTTAWHAYMLAFLFEQANLVSGVAPRKLAAFIPPSGSTDSMRSLPAHQDSNPVKGLLPRGEPDE